MKKERKDDSFIKQPFYEGGDNALRSFINENLVYPETSRLNGTDGHVNLKYDINYKGDVIDVKVISGLDNACNEEAIRVVKLLKFIVPKNPRNLKITFHKNIRIQFNINKPATAPVEIIQQTQIVTNFQYNLVTTVPKPEEEIQKVTYNYSYTY